MGTQYIYVKDVGSQYKEKFVNWNMKVWFIVKYARNA